MKIIRKTVLMQQYALRCKREGKKIVLVPTMGALHDGHISLLRRAKKTGGCLVASIYVNPTQFGPKEDFSRYPRPFRDDAALCEKEGVDVLFAPSVLYGAAHSTWVEETACSVGLCGASRPSHFKGVATVVAKLFNIVQPDTAVFGQKDAQQCEVIRQMVGDLNFPVRLIIAPTLRERDGLAMSSRNRYLTLEERMRAPQFHAILEEASKLPPKRVAGVAAKKLGADGFVVDYVQIFQNRLCAAVFLGKTRLIDNVPMPAVNCASSRKRPAK